MKSSDNWVVVDEKLPVLTCDYNFGPGYSRAIAVGGADGLIVVSPPCSPSEANFADLDRHGKVRALVASNAFHHLGIPAWKKRYPDAQIFAPAQAIARVSKKSGLGDVKPLEEAKALCGPNVDLLDMPHYKTGELLMRARVGGGSLWYVTDVIMNMQALPPGFPFNLLFKWTGSAPGLKLNGLVPMFMMKDKNAVWSWLLSEAEKEPPHMLIPAHGKVLHLDKAKNEVLEMLRAR